MPLLSTIARRRKVEYFFSGVPRGARILEIGCGDGWLRPALEARGFTRHVGLDLRPPADVVGDVNAWREIGLAPGSFDVIVAFEVVEHVDCFAACLDLLAPGGSLFVTTPVPQRDWVMRILEALRLNQKRTSPHDYLVDLRNVTGFSERRVEIMGGLSQWAVLRKDSAAAAAANGARTVQYT
ncbi:MAG TPA: class I SAM-dependent methyltransferase [Anaeromyxobacteraceae bacterium]|nr:class I SAM-dependent methyltransferase [Anaeromyxobacteraceae bacterium]